MSYLSKFLAIAVLFLAVSAQAKRIQINNDEAVEVKAEKTASTGNDLRKVRRLGFGVMTAGPLGLGGLDLELNFSSRSSLLFGFGGGPGYQSWTAQYKRVLAGEWLLPYMAVGFSHWYNFEKKPGIKETSPGILEERLMSQSDKEAGIIDEYLIYPAAGVQFVQLDGPWAGFSVSLEVDVLLDLVDFVAAPTGGVGVSYYF